MEANFLGMVRAGWEFKCFGNRMENRKRGKDFQNIYFNKVITVN